MRLLLCIVLFTAACAAQPHVQLTAPAPSAAPADRVAAYGKLRGKDQSETVVTDAHGEVQGASADFLILGGGDVVYHAEDLVPVVPEASHTAQAAHRGVDYGHAAWPYQLAGLVVAVAGAGLGGYGLVADDGATLPVIGLGLMFAGTGLAGIPTIYYDQREQDERISAFKSYDADLRQRLDVCVNGLEVVACGAAAKAP